MNSLKSKLAIKQLKEIEKLIEGKKLRLAAEWDEEWMVLISTILSPQTKDETTIKVCDDLFLRYPSIKDLSKARISSVEKIIRRVNYYRTKAKNVVFASKMIEKEFKGEIPFLVDDLIKLPGVGRKVANVYLNEALKKEAIAVDTHVARISYKMGWTKNKNPHKIEKDLEKLFPKRYWLKINHILVNFGRIYGKSRRKEDEIFRGIKSLI